MRLPAPALLFLLANAAVAGAQAAPSPEARLKEAGRIPMRTRTLTSPVEQLTIGIEQRTRGGILRVQWDTTEAYGEFGVR